MNFRLRILFVFFLLIFSAAIGRLFFLQVLSSDRYVKAAERQQTVSESIEFSRGDIFFSSRGAVSNNVPAALTKQWWHIWISPKDVLPEQRVQVASRLSQTLSIEQESILKRLEKEGDPYEPLLQKASDEMVQKVRALNVPGIGWNEVRDRYYPLGNLGAHVLGFLGHSQNKRLGQYGLEEFYQSKLEGNSSLVKGLGSAISFLIKPFASSDEAPNNKDIHTTIDYNIQLVLEKELAGVRQKYSASSATGIVLDPKTGAVIAMATTPSFDPNEYSKVPSISRFLNPAVQSVFEPGSIFKPITMAVGLDVNVISPDLVYIDHGRVTVEDRIIKNSTNEAQGAQTMTQALEKSLNTGAVFAVQRIPAGVWQEYLEKFGFNEKTGIDLAGEVSSDIRAVLSRNEVQIATSAFGQGIALTPISISAAISTIANGGVWSQPFVVKDIESLKSKRVLKDSTALAVSKMMVSVVENGSGRRAKINGYSVAGKTGTAQIPSPEGGYSKETIQSFVGFAPAFDPRFVMLVMIERPQGVEFSELSAAPVFQKVGEFILHYYGVEPDRPLTK